MVGRDLRMLARRRRTYVIRALFTGGLVLTALFTWCGETATRRLPSDLLWLVIPLGGLMAVFLGLWRPRAGPWKPVLRVAGIAILAGTILWFAGQPSGELRRLQAEMRDARIGVRQDWDVGRMASFGTGLFTTTSTVGALLIAFLAPALTAGAVAQEKERGTLQLLQATQLGGPEIVLGKAVGRLLILYLLIAAGMPVLASCMLFGGVGPAHVVVVALNLFAIATLCASVGFLFSVLCRRTHTALMASYAVLAAYTVLVPAALVHLQSVGLWRIMAYFNPALALEGFLSGVQGDWLATMFGAFTGWARGLECLPFCALVSLACFLAAVRLFPAFADRQPTHVWKRMFQRLDSFFDRLNWGLWRIDFRSDRLEGNPVSWKERHFRLLGKTDYLIRAGWMMGIGLCVLYAILTLHNPGVWWEARFHMTVLVPMASLLYLAVTILASSSIAAEKDRGTWDLLLSTALSGRRILGGKIYGTVRSGLVFLVLPIAHLALASIAGLASAGMHYSVAFAVIVVLISGAYLQLSVGTYFSIRSRSALNAFLWTLGFGLAVNLVVPVGLCFLVRDDEPLSLSPTTALAFVLNHPQSPFRFGDKEWIALACSAGYSVVSCWLIFWMTTHFDQLVGRSPDTDRVSS
jgi:ABC-type transport system involved in multi-copper enzyme maturation permease subunit